MAPTAETRTLIPESSPAQAFQEAAQQMMTAQASFFREAVEGQLAMMAELRTAATRFTSAADQATFKTRVTSGGRISVPDAEREALNLKEGDLVQVILVPLRRAAPGANASPENRTE